jgi:hypothetical protein
LEDVPSETGHLTGDGPVAILVEDPHATVAHETRMAAAANRRFVRESTANFIGLHTCSEVISMAFFCAVRPWRGQVMKIDKSATDGATVRAGLLAVDDLSIFMT